MTYTTSPSKTLNALLWVAQWLLSATLLWAAIMKLSKSAGELAAMWPWTAAYPLLVKVTGIIDLLCALGLILPGLLRIKRKLTILAAYSVIALMLAACVFHVMRGEASAIGFNIVVAVIAGFIAWGRSRQV